MKMADSSNQIDIENILSYSDDLVGVLRSTRDINNVICCLDRSSASQSSVAADFEDVQSSIRDYQRKVDECKQRTDEARSYVVGDEKVDNLQRMLDEELCREKSLRAEVREIEKQTDDLDKQRLLVEDRRRNLKTHGQDVAKARSKLSFYASVTNIIPNLDSDPYISGQIVKRDKDVVEMFEVDFMNADPFDTFNNIWKMIG